MERWQWVAMIALIVTAVWWRQSRVARLREGSVPVRQERR